MQIKMIKYTLHWFITIIYTKMTHRDTELAVGKAYLCKDIGGGWNHIKS